MDPVASEAKRPRQTEDELPLITCEVVADVACPFCHIGSAKIVEHLASQGVDVLGSGIVGIEPSQLKVELKFVPFFLNPDLVLPPDGLEFSEYMREAGKLGDMHNESNAIEAVAQLKQMAGTCATPLEMKTLGDGNRVWPSVNALGAACIIAPRSPGGNLAANATMMALFHANFEEGKNIASEAVLRAILATTAPGLSQSDLDAVGSEAVREEVKQMASSAKFIHKAQGVPLFRLKVAGVPLPKGRVVCPPGVQEPETFVKIFEYLHELAAGVKAAS